VRRLTFGRILERIFVGLTGKGVPVYDRGVPLKGVVEELIRVGQEGMGSHGKLKLWSNHMTWPIFLQSVYREGVLRDIRDDRWERMFMEKLKEMGVDYIMSSNGGRIHSKEFIKIVEPEEGRVAMYSRMGQWSMSGSEWFSRKARREADMKRLFGADALPVRGVPKLIERGIDMTMNKGRWVMKARKDAIDHIFGMANSEEPAVRLIYTLCVIMSAHPHIVRAGSNLFDKKWDEPDFSRKHRTDKSTWAVAFAFSGLFYSGRVDRGDIKMDTIKKGFLGEYLVV
jgi:hypothetical protein